MPYTLITSSKTMCFLAYIQAVKAFIKTQLAKKLDFYPFLEISNDYSLEKQIIQFVLIVTKPGFASRCRRTLTRPTLRPVPSMSFSFTSKTASDTHTRVHAVPVVL